MLTSVLICDFSWAVGCWYDRALLAYLLVENRTEYKKYFSHLLLQLSSWLLIYGRAFILPLPSPLSHPCVLLIILKAVVRWKQRWCCPQPCSVFSSHPPLYQIGEIQGWVRGEDRTSPHRKRPMKKGNEGRKSQTMTTKKAFPEGQMSQPSSFPPPPVQWFAQSLKAIFRWKQRWCYPQPCSAFSSLAPLCTPTSLMTRQQEGQGKWIQMKRRKRGLKTDNKDL